VDENADGREEVDDEDDEDDVADDEDGDGGDGVGEGKSDNIGGVEPELIVVNEVIVGVDD